MTREGSDQTGPSDPVNSENSNIAKIIILQKLKRSILKTKNIIRIL